MLLTVRGITKIDTAAAIVNFAAQACCAMRIMYWTLAKRSKGDWGRYRTVDYALIGLCHRGAIVVMQDYGAAV